MTAYEPLSDLEAEREALLRFMYMCPVGLLKITGDGTISMVNPHAASLLMAAAEDGVLENLFDILAPHDAELRRRVQDFAGRSGDICRGHRISLRPRHPGQSIHVLSCNLLMINRDCLMVLLQDVSQEVALELAIAAASRQALANERLVALGTMAGGLAHEINNPLAIIHALAEELGEMAARGAVPPDRVAETAADMMALSARIERIMRSVLRLARDGAADPLAVARLADIVRDAENLCRSLFRDGGVDLIVAPIDPRIALSCREVQITQILVNLLQNAFYAAKAGDAAPAVRLETRRNGAEIELRISDSGLGVPSAIRERIMEPFFTTKPVGEGTGLGLSVAAEIARAHGGRLSLDAAAVETCFVLTLTALAEQASP